MSETDRAEDTQPLWLRRAGLLGGPFVAAAMALAGPPADLAPAGWHAAAIGVLMAMWWISEAVPLAATALLPLVLFPPSGVAGFDQAARSYAHPLIFLFLGGFMLARAMERWQLHRRVAARMIAFGGGSGPALVASVMAATAFLSMWVSNTATAMVMLPIGQSIVAGVRERHGATDRAAADAFAAALMLGVAYAATIGGMGTLIGTPPNALFAGFMARSYGIEIGFARWLLIGIPVVAALLPLTWVLLTRVSFPALRRIEDGGEHASALAALGPMTGPERRLALVIVLVALGWLTRPLLADLAPGVALSDAGIAMTGALALFLVPARWSEGSSLLDWSDMRRLRWDVLILFGGGLALAGAIEETGLARWIGSLLAGLGHLPRPVLVPALMLGVVWLGELASNTAMAAVLLPVVGAAAVAMGQGPLALALPVALAASLGFMLPVATPPNAIVYGSGAVSARQMLRAGALLDVLSVAIVGGLALALGRLVG